MSIVRKVAILGIVMAAPTLAAAQESMRILTYPTGLVTGRLLVNVDLGVEGRPADLYLDGAKACSLSAESPSCTVDLGPDPHLHRLELVREAGDRVERWVNRPGQEAELTLEPVRSGSRCGARIRWAHPGKLNPVELEVTLAGAEPRIADGGHRVFYPCPEPGSTQILVAMAVFADGRRVEAAAVIGGLGDETSVELYAVPLVVDVDTPCESGAPGWPPAAEKLEKSGFEVVVVLDPDARYELLYASGWNTGRLENTSGASTKVFDQLVRRGSKNSEPKPKSSWLKAKTTFFDANRLWYVAPDQGLHRINGFGQGRPNWLDLLFRFGLAKVPGKPRIADAVAASGLVAAAGPHRRAVVLILGNNVHKRDGSLFSPQQARNYLAEINVPLIVLRNGRPSEDGWPRGLSALNMEALAKSLQAVRKILDAQCIAWLSPEWSPNRLAAVLPEGVRLAGRSENAPVSPDEGRERAEIETVDPLPEGLTVERLAITAITVLLSATDGEGRPLTDLSTDDFDLLEDGRPVTILDLSPVLSAEAVAPTEGAVATSAVATVDEAKELPVAIYVDRTVGGGFDQRQALRAVTGEIERLAALGPVEIVVAEKAQVKTVIGPTRDPSALAKALQRLSASTSGQHPIERIRRHFVQDIRQIPDRTNAVQAENGELSTTFGARTAFAARTSAGEENVIVSRFLEQLRFWAQRETGQRAGLLVVVGAGFDEDPLDFLCIVD